MLELIDVRPARSRATGRRRHLPDTPIVIVANHPFGIGDGIAVLSLAEQLGRPFRVLINDRAVEGAGDGALFAADLVRGNQAKRSRSTCRPATRRCGS